MTLVVGSCDGAAPQTLRARLGEAPSMAAMPPGIVPLIASFLGHHDLYISAVSPRVGTAPPKRFILGVNILASPVASYEYIDIVRHAEEPPDVFDDSVVAVGDDILRTGGRIIDCNTRSPTTRARRFTPRSCAHRFTPTTREWTECSPMTVARWGHVAIAARDAVLVVGGSTPDGAGGIRRAPCEIYGTDKSDDGSAPQVWRPVAQMRVARVRLRGAACGAAVYAWGSGDHRHITGERYDIASGVWTDTRDLTFQCLDHCVAVEAAKLLVGVGWSTRDGDRYTVALYCVRTDTWRAAPWELPDATSPPAVLKVVAGHLVYVTYRRVDPIKPAGVTTAYMLWRLPVGLVASTDFAAVSAAWVCGGTPHSAAPLSL